MTLEEAKQQLKSLIDHEHHLYTTSTMPENRAYHLAVEYAYKNALTLIGMVQSVGGVDH